MTNRSTSRPGPWADLAVAAVLTLVLAIAAYEWTRGVTLGRSWCPPATPELHDPCARHPGESGPVGLSNGGVIMAPG